MFLKRQKFKVYCILKFRKQDFTRYMLRRVTCTHKGNIHDGTPWCLSQSAILPTDLRFLSASFGDPISELLPVLIWLFSLLNFHWRIFLKYISYPTRWSRPTPSIQDVRESGNIALMTVVSARFLLKDLAGVFFLFDVHSKLAGAQITWRGHKLCRHVLWIELKFYTVH